MASRILVFSLLIICGLAGSTEGLWAETITPWNIQGLSFTSECSSPMISGTKLVWQAKGGFTETTSGRQDWEIFMYDLVNQTVIQITDDDYDDIAPQTDGAYVVWQKQAGSLGSQIYLYRIQGSNPAGGSLISPPGSTGNYTPKIMAARVVWTSQSVTGSFEAGRIMLYNAAAESGPVGISDPKVDCSDPHIDGQQVIWMQDFNNGTRPFYRFDLTSTSPSPQPVPENYRWNRSASVDGNQKVLTRHDGFDREIFLHTRSGGFIQITDNNLADSNPVISQNHIAWTTKNDIYLAEIARFIQVPTAGDLDNWPTGFRALWAEPSGGVEGYYLDVATDPDFLNYVDGFRSLYVGNVTEFAVPGLSSDVTYYYRVSAIINGSATAYSETVTVTLPKEQPGTAGQGVRVLPFIYKLLLD